MSLLWSFSGGNEHILLLINWQQSQGKKNKNGGKNVFSGKFQGLQKQKKDFSGSTVKKKKKKREQECNFLCICQVKCKLSASPISAAWFVCASQAKCHRLPNDWQARKWTTKTSVTGEQARFRATKTVCHWTVIIFWASTSTSHQWLGVWKAAVMTFLVNKRLAMRSLSTWE